MNAGTAKGALQLEDQFSDALDKFKDGMEEAKEGAADMSRSTEAAQESTADFMKSVRELADSMAEEAKAATDAQLATGTLGKESKETANDQEKLTKEARAAAAALEKERKEANDLSHEFGGMSDLFKATAAGFGITLGIESAIGAVKNFAMETIELGSKIKDLSERAGLGVEQFQELQYAITQTGGKMEDIEKATTKLNDKLTEGKKGTVVAVHQLGLELEDLQNMKPGDAFLAIANAIAKVPDPMQQSQLALELLGNSGAKWLPAIKSGMGELRDEAHKLGQVLSEKDVEALDEFGDRYDQTMNRLKIASATTALTIADGFKSSWKDIAKSFVDEIKGIDVTSLATSFGAAIAREGIKNRNTRTTDIKLDVEADPAMKKKLADEKKAFEEAEKLRKKDIAATEAWAKSVQDAYDKAVGKDLQDTVKRTQQALAKLTTEQRNNKTVVQALLKPYEDIRDKIKDLPPELEKVRNEMGKRLSTNDDIFALMSKSLTQLKPNIQSTQLQMNMLRTDGLLPVHDVTGKVADAFDTLNVKQRQVVIETKTLGETFKETFEKLNVGEMMVQSAIDGFKSGGVKGAAAGIADTLNGVLSSAITQVAKSNMGNVMGGLVGQIFSAGVSFMIQELSNEFDDSWKDFVQQARVARNDILNEFGGSQKRMDDAMDRAGVNKLTQSKIRNSRDPEILSKEWETAREAITKYRVELDGLSNSLDGVSKIGEQTFNSLRKSAEDQQKAVLDGQQLVIDAMEREGATAEELEQRKAYFADLNKDRTFTATDEQIKQFERLGTIAGGVIANIAGRTGDLVGAFQAAADTLDPMLELSRQFDLTGKLDPATQEVLRFYGVIKDNAEVFTTVQGVGQVLNGLGDAAVRNVDLVNALGGSLEESALKLQAAGVSVEDIYAMLSPQLQELWETVKDGKLAVDDTTKALLDQAEAQGVVGDNMRDVNEQILMVLTEIRDMFMDDLPEAVDQFNDHVQNSNEQTGNAIRRTAQQARSDWTNGMGRANEEWKYDTDATAESIKRKLKTIPKDFGINVDWDVAPLVLPDPETYHIPTEYDPPENGAGPGGTPPPPPDPPAGDPYTGAAVQRPGEAASRGNTTFILEDAGAPLIRFTAENIPGYVRVRSGNMVHSV